MNVMKKLAFLLFALAVSVPCLGKASWEFETDGNLEGWKKQRADKIIVEDGMLRVSMVADQKDPYAWKPVTLDGSQYTGVYFRIRYSAPATDLTGARFFFHDADNKPKGFNYHTQVPDVNDGFKTIFIDAMHEDYPFTDLWSTTTIKRLRFDMQDNVPVEYTVDFDWVRMAGEFLDNEGFEYWDFDNDTIAGWTVSDSNAVSFDVTDPNLINTGEWAAAVTGTGEAVTLTQDIKGGLDLPKGQYMVVDTALLVPEAAKDAEIVVHIAEQDKDGQWTVGSPIEVNEVDSYFLASTNVILELEPEDRTGLRVEIIITSPADTLIYVDETLIGLPPEPPEEHPHPDLEKAWPVNCVMLSDGQVITIDGNVSPEEYVGAQAIVINKDTCWGIDPFDPNVAHEMFIDGDEYKLTAELEDYNATYYVMWDVNNFYIACSVEDDIYAYKGDKPNNSDALQFTLAETAFEQEKAMVYIPTIAPADADGKVEAMNTFSATTFINWDLFDPALSPGVEWAGSVDEATQDWTVELKIPWPILVGDFRNDIFDPHPALGLQVGFSVVAIDFDHDTEGNPVNQLLGCTHPGAFPWQLVGDKTSEIMTFVDANGEVPATE